MPHLAQGAGDWPKATEIDPTRLQAARAIKDKVIKDDLDSSKLTGWQLASTKPRKAELHWLADSVAPKAGMRPRRLSGQNQASILPSQHPDGNNKHQCSSCGWVQTQRLLQQQSAPNSSVSYTSAPIATLPQLCSSSSQTLALYVSIVQSDVICVCCDTSSNPSLRLEPTLHAHPKKDKGFGWNTL